MSFLSHFPWLTLNWMRKTCPALQCIRVVVCRTAFFHKSTFIFENCLLKSRKKCLSRKLLTLIIIIIIIIFVIIVIVHLLTVDKKIFHKTRQKTLIKISQKRAKIIYLHKSVSIDFFIIFIILEKRQELSCGNVE